MKTKNRKIYHMKSITEINTLQCLHETQVWNYHIKAYRNLYYNCNVFMKTKYRTMYHMKSITEINILHVSMKMKYRAVYHMKSKTAINTLQCLHDKSMKSTEINTLCFHENQVQNIVSHEKHNRN